jgi:class 3 adenylate cyclase
MDRTRTIIREAHFDRPVAEVWQALSDTERLNHVTSAGFTPYQAEEVLQPDGRVIRHAHKRFGPFTWRWKEALGQWVERRFLRQDRVFENGPFKELSIFARFYATETGTQVSIEFFARWATILGDALVALGFLQRITGQVMKGMERLVADHGAAQPVAEDAAGSYAREARARRAQQQLAAAIAELEAGPYGHGLAGRLAGYLSSANALDLRRLRPLALAHEWDLPPEQVVELFVAAHKAGLLAMRWEIMCPRCRGGKSKSLLLSDTPREVHCTSCNIDYERDFANNVELVFSPPQWLRNLPDGELCTMSPATTRHIKVQCDVPPGETRIEQAALTDGRYRIRTLEAGNEREVELVGGVVPEILVSAAGISTGDPGPAGEVRMVNRDSRLHGVVIENTAWSEDALTGPKVIVSPAFRELCPEQLLRAGDSVGIDAVTILFSDLKGSTALYEAVGDARAFSLVHDHFAFLEQHIRRHRGTIIKTIGDAVMAAFADEEAALAAAINIQDDVISFNKEHGALPIELKIGLHEGQCIAVTTDDFLDYFGSTVNMAARLQSQASGGEIVLSREIAAQPFAKAALKNRKTAWKRASLAGFEKPVPFLAISFK